MRPPEGCESYRELIGAFVLGELSGEELEAIQRHIDGCPECWAEAMELGAVVAALSQADPERIDEYRRPPADLEESTLAPTPEDIPRGRRFWWLTPAAAAIFAFVIGLGGLTLYLDQDERTGSSSPHVPSGPSAEDRAPDSAQGRSQAIGPEDRRPPKESSPRSDVKWSSPDGERPGTAPEKSEPGRAVNEPPTSAPPTSAPPTSASSASAPASSARSTAVPASASPVEPPASSTPTATSTPSGEPSAASALPVEPPASAPASSAPPPSSAPPASSSPPEQQYY